MLGWILETKKLIVSMTLCKLEMVQFLLGEWSVSHQTATFRYV